MGGTRVHIVLSAEERATYRAAAARAGESLSEWLRQAARLRLARTEPGRLDDRDALDAFFEECDDREGDGREPDWQEHLAVIERARPAAPA